MFRKWHLLILFCSILSLFGCDNNSDSNAKQLLVIGLDDDFPPMGFRDNNNEIVGYDIDLAAEAFKRANIDITFKAIDWSSKEAELNSGRIDVLWNGLTITENRKKVIDFTKPYMKNHQIIIVRKDDKISSKSHLKNKIVGLQNGSSAQDAVSQDEVSKEFSKLNLYPNNIAALLDLSNKRVDAVVVDEVVGRYYLHQKTNTFKILTDYFGEEEYCVGIKKGNEELLDKINHALDSMKQDGTHDRIYKKWFATDF